MWKHETRRSVLEDTLYTLARDDTGALSYCKSPLSAEERLLDQITLASKAMAFRASNTPCPSTSSIPLQHVLPLFGLQEDVEIMLLFHRCNLVRQHVEGPRSRPLLLLKSIAEKLIAAATDRIASAAQKPKHAAHGLVVVPGLAVGYIQDRGGDR